MFGRKVVLFSLLGALALACSASEPAEKLCTPDANVFCRCEDRAAGTKKCNSDGASFQDCLPCDGTGNPGPGSDPYRPDPLAAPSSLKGGGDPDALTSDGDEDKDDEKPTPKADAGASTTGAEDQRVTFPDVPHCQPMKNIAPKIEIQDLADSPTTPVGGQPSDGVYVQGWVVRFTGPDGDSGPTKTYSRQTLEIMGAVGRYAFEEADGKLVQGGFRLTATDTGKVNVSYECPATTEPRDLGYDATPNQIIIYDPPFARVFFKQKGAAQ